MAGVGLIHPNRAFNAPRDANSTYGTAYDAPVAYSCKEPKMACTHIDAHIDLALPAQSSAWLAASLAHTQVPQHYRDPRHETLFLLCHDPLTPTAQPGTVCTQRITSAGDERNQPKACQPTKHPGGCASSTIKRRAGGKRGVPWRLQIGHPADALSSSCPTLVVPR